MTSVDVELPDFSDKKAKKLKKIFDPQIKFIGNQPISVFVLAVCFLEREDLDLREVFQKQLPEVFYKKECS